MYIDDTFEIQIKTMFFEGWHEIEHDMRYKGEELWKNYKGFSRYFNSILATLELCDKSMVTLFGSWTFPLQIRKMERYDQEPFSFEAWRGTALS